MPRLRIHAPAPVGKNSSRTGAAHSPADKPFKHRVAEVRDGSFATDPVETGLPGLVLELSCAEFADNHGEPCLHLAKGVFRKTNPAGLSDPLNRRNDSRNFSWVARWRRAFSIHSIT